MNYRPQLGPKALAKLGGFPTDALSDLRRMVGRVCEDPYDAVFRNEGLAVTKLSKPVGPEPVPAGDHGSSRRAMRKGKREPSAGQP